MLTGNNGREPQETDFVSRMLNVCLWAPSPTWLPRWLSGKEPTCQNRGLRRHRFDPWAGKISWKRKGQPTPVFLPGISQRQRSLVGCSPWVAKSRTRLSNWTHTHTPTHLAQPGEEEWVILPGAHLSLVVEHGRSQELKHGDHLMEWKFVFSCSLPKNTTVKRRALATWTRE